LLLSERVEVSGLRIIREPHRGTRGGPSNSGASLGTSEAGVEWRYVDLSHVVTDGMTTYPGLPAPEITPYLSRSRAA